MPRGTHVLPIWLTNRPQGLYYVSYFMSPWSVTILMKLLNEKVSKSILHPTLLDVESMRVKDGWVCAFEALCYCLWLQLWHNV
jgi:hypothetical protein